MLLDGFTIYSLHGKEFKCLFVFVYYFLQTRRQSSLIVLDIHSHLLSPYLIIPYSRGCWLFPRMFPHSLVIEPPWFLTGQLDYISQLPLQLGMAIWVVSRRDVCHSRFFPKGCAFLLFLPPGQNLDRDAGNYQQSSYTTKCKSSKMKMGYQKDRSLSHTS